MNFYTPKKLKRYKIYSFLNPGVVKFSKFVVDERHPKLFLWRFLLTGKQSIKKAYPKNPPPPQTSVYSNIRENNVTAHALKWKNETVF